MLQRGVSAFQGGLAVAFATASASLYSSQPIGAYAFAPHVKRLRSRLFASSTSAKAMSKMNQSFETWSFDEPCTTMAWTELVPASLSVTADTNEWDEADLVIVGVFSPKNDDEDGEDDEEKEEEAPTVVLSGGAESLDKKLGGALSQIMLESSKEFKHGAKAGSSTPTLRIFSEGKSRRYIVMGLGTEPSDDDDADVVLVDEAVTPDTETERLAMADRDIVERFRINDPAFSVLHCNAR